MDNPFPGAGQLNGGAITVHEFYTALREAGFSRPEALYIITRPMVETSRLEWCASRKDGGNP